MILDKAKMAHDWYMKHSESPSFMDTEIRMAWEYADAMQAEADKRVVKLPDVFFDTKKDEEWKPDWSQAPEWANWWAVDKNLEARWILSADGEPYIGMVGSKWFSLGKFNSEPSPHFNYIGKWQDSLRKRPN